MSITCKNCKHENPDDSSFCNHCGKEIFEDTSSWIAINEKEIKTELKRIITGFKEDLDGAADRKLHQTLDNFQERATKWVRYQFIAVTTAASIVVGILAYVGFKGFDIKQLLDQTTADYIDKLDKNKELVETGKADLEKIRTNAIKEAESAKTLAAAKMDELKKIKTDEITDLDTRLQKQIARVDDLEKILLNKVSEINKIERSRYQILVHHESADIAKDREENIDKLRNALYEKGYIVGADDIFNVSADRQEIIYYSDTKDMADKVDEIIKLLPAEYKPIRKKLEKSGNNDPFQVVIKLCANGISSGVDCRTEK